MTVVGTLIPSEGGGSEVHSFVRKGHGTHVEELWDLFRRSIRCASEGWVSLTLYCLHIMNFSDSRILGNTS